MVAAGMKTQADEIKKQTDAMMAQMTPMMRIDVEEQRAKDKADFEFMQKDYADYWPADPMVLVARHLRAYVANAADVDFTAKQVPAAGGDGMTFVNAAYNAKPSQWRVSYDYGPEVTAAGRAAAAAWLKELK